MIYEHAHHPANRGLTRFVMAAAERGEETHVREVMDVLRNGKMTAEDVRGLMHVVAETEASTVSLNVMAILGVTITDDQALTLLTTQHDALIRVAERRLAGGEMLVLGPLVRIAPYLPMEMRPRIGTLLLVYGRSMYGR